MNKKSSVVISIFSLLLLALSVEIIYLSIYKSMSESASGKKIAFVRTVGLPDLAISTENPYIRHRSISDIFAIYPDDGALREYSYSSFSISNFKAQP